MDKQKEMMTTQVEEKQEPAEKNKSLIVRIFNSPVSIIVVLILFSICLMVYTRYLIKSTTLYTFAAYEDNFSFMNGSIFIGRDVNYFGDSKVYYTGEDITIYDFQAGYFIKDGEVYKEISVITGYDVEDETDKEQPGAKIKELVESSDYSFTEVHKEAMFLSKENVNNIKNLVFRITGKDKKGEKIEFEIPMEVVKVTK